MTAPTQPDALFAPPTERWTPVSPKFVTVETISLFLGWPLFIIASLVPTIIWAPWWVPALIGLFWVVFLSWRLWAVRRTARTWAYAERDTDLYVTHGLLFKQLVVVPYGRMQVVEVSAGPLLRRYGLANVELKTAGRDVIIPGVTADEAARLRESLAKLGETQAAGL
ncbi:PH domain-containing protein [Propionibacteriaceae bacterium G1746]|uniref:PH domain-containing protein n=1 Tax=Aestuariimicrobium sp. G57 TaxID=3418485 RepID=UPI003C145F2A